MNIIETALSIEGLSADIDTAELAAIVGRASEFRSRPKAPPSRRPPVMDFAAKIRARELIVADAYSRFIDTTNTLAQRIDARGEMLYRMQDLKTLLGD